MKSVLNSLAPSSRQISLTEAFEQSILESHTYWAEHHDFASEKGSCGLFATFPCFGVKTKSQLMEMVWIAAETLVRTSPHLGGYVPANFRDRISFEFVAVCEAHASLMEVPGAEDRVNHVHLAVAFMKKQFRITRAIKLALHQAFEAWAYDIDGHKPVGHYENLRNISSAAEYFRKGPIEGADGKPLMITNRPEINPADKKKNMTLLKNLEQVRAVHDGDKETIMSITPMREMNALFRAVAMLD